MRACALVVATALSLAGGSLAACSFDHSIKSLGFVSAVPRFSSDRRIVQVFCGSIFFVIFWFSLRPPWIRDLRSGFVYNSPESDLQSLSARRSHVVAPLQLSMKADKESKMNLFRSLAKRISQGAVLVASLAIGIAGPQKASAKNNQYGISSEGQYYSYAPQQSAPAPYGVAAGLTALTFGGMCAVAIKKEKSAVAQDQETIEKELDRLLQYKQEFLEGVPSDRSIYASLAKAMTKDTAPAKSTKQEDEFEKNVRAFLEEEEAKNQKKQTDKKKDGMGKGPGSIVLERPGDIDGSKTDAWMNDIEIDDKPAEIAEEDLKRLQRMFGGGDLPKL
jgi:hypothetical protein